jgi:hypothetical protein
MGNVKETKTHSSAPLQIFFVGNYDAQVHLSVPTTS